MSRDTEPRIYNIEFIPKDAGYQLQIRMDDWMEIVEEDFTSFDQISGVFRADMESIRERLREETVEVTPELEEDAHEDREYPQFRLKSIPQKWADDPGEMAEVYAQFNTLLARMGLYALTQREIKELKEFISNDQYKAALVRESAFIEEYISFRSQIVLQEQKGDVLSNEEIKIIKGMRHQDRIRLARLYGELSEDEHALLQEMVKRRNQVAHTAWSDFDEQDEAQIESTAKRVLNYLEKQIEDAEYFVDDVDEIQDTDDFIGFNALDVDTQYLQLSILIAMDKLGGSATLADVQRVLDEDPELVEQRFYHINAVGYIEEYDGEYRLTDAGWELLAEEVP